MPRAFFISLQFNHMLHCVFQVPVNPGTPRGPMLYARLHGFPPLLPQPETNGLTAISRANCLSVASFCTADVHLFGSGYPRSGQGIGAPFGLPFRAYKREGAVRGRNPGLPVH
jgi:hypothetical protein